MADELQRLLQQNSQTLSQDAAAMMMGGGGVMNNNNNITTTTSATLAASGFGVPGGNASLCEKLIFLAENERHAPEILPYPGELLEQLQLEMKQRKDEIDQMRHQSHQQHKNRTSDSEADALLGIINNNQDDADGTHNNRKHGGGGKDTTNPNRNVQISASSTLPFRVEDLLQLELTRLKYAVADLIRVRLQKLQFYREAILAEPTRYEPLLCENEVLLVQSLSDIFTKAMMQGGLSQLPLEYRKEPSSALPHADPNRYVLAIALEACELVLTNVQDPKPLAAGDSYICPFEAVRRHVADGRIRLM